MNEDYLWDRSGPPDLEIVRLERALSHFRGGKPKPVMRRYWPLAIAASVLLALALYSTQQKPAAWKMTALSGDPVLRFGTLSTDKASQARLTSDWIGEVELAPDSELSISGGQRLSLRAGKLHAFIWAPPAQFVVDTPGARAIDLGCEYTLETDRRGDGVLKVRTGWVAFDWKGQESFIPAHALCRTYHGRGPGTPWFESAPEPLVAALARFDAAGDRQAIREVLTEARRADALTLWHLLARADREDRGAVFDRLAVLVGGPAGIREAAIAGDRGALDQLWNLLDLGSTEFWRGWKRRW